MFADQPHKATSDFLAGNFTVQYAIPGRQVFLIVGGVFLLLIGIMALALWLQSATLVAALCLPIGGWLVWWIFSNLYTRGEASLEEAGIELMHGHRVFCAPGGPFRIAWENVEKVETGIADGLKPREYVILRVSEPPLSLILMPLAGEPDGFVQKVMEFFNASRMRAGKPAIKAADPMSGVGWRVTAGIGLAVFASLVIAAALNPGKLDAMMIGRIVAVGGFVLVLAGKVFGERRQR